ncbi:histidine kinase [Bacillus spongiae]|uniref:histidine kinase n=1 Tax=Bacillus spongiae TaxID=2683610 RepID=A0ABU8HJH2_9BACI
MAFLYPYWQTDVLAYLLFGYALFLIVYFFMPLTKYKLVLYFALHIILSLILWIASVDSFSSLLPLFLFILLEAVFQLRVKAFRMFVLATSLIILAFVYYWQLFSVTWLFILMLYFFLSIVVNHSFYDIRQSRELYSHLLDEYRQLKRRTLENEKTARLEERTRIAREIHDSVGHKLTALLMQIEIVMESKDISVVNSLKSLAKESLEETREAVKTLQSEEVEGISSVIELIRKLESENHVSVVLTTKQGVLSVKLSARQSIVLYRVIQESLTNAMKHSHSRKIDVLLGRTAIGDIEVTVKNMLVEKVPFQFGFGLTNMKGRVEEIEGTLRVYQTEQAFIVNATFPIKERG